MTSVADDEARLEEDLKKKFSKGWTSQSTARPPKASSRVANLVLPEGERGKVPLTSEKYLVKENPHLVQWERETRKFLRQLKLSTGHRVSPTMVFEWATGLNIAQMMEEGDYSYRREVRLIKQILQFYFGESYQTWIAGKKVLTCFKIRKGYQIKYHRPKTVTLYAEYCDGVLEV